MQCLGQCENPKDYHYCGILISHLRSQDELITKNCESTSCLSKLLGSHQLYAGINLNLNLTIFLSIPYH